MKYDWWSGRDPVSLTAMADRSLIKGDPRPWFALLLGSYVVCGLSFFGFCRTPWQI